MGEKKGIDVDAGYVYVVSVVVHTALDLALINGNKEIAEILLGKGAKCKTQAAKLQEFQEERKQERIARQREQERIERQREQERIARQREQERIERQREQERKEKENKRGEEMNKALTNIQCPDRIVEYLLQEQSAKKEKQENEIVQQMTDGRIPMGFSSHPLWSETHEKVSKLPAIISEKEEKLAALVAEQKIISEKIQKWQQKLKMLS